MPGGTLGQELRDHRARHGLSQRSLARRVGTSQDAISRIERGVESPSFERFSDLLLAMGERPVLRTEPLAAVHPEDLQASRALSPRERLYESASWNLVATRLELAGAMARRAGHPATRRSS
jgi:transcriptional regulator with XRE-family HTH domain